MIKLGFKRSELNDGSFYGCAPCCPHDDAAKKSEWENAIILPEVRFEGKQAEAMGVDSLELDEEVEVTFKLRVSELRNVERMVSEKKQRDLALVFQILETSDLVSAGGKPDDKDKDDDSAEGSPLGALLGRGKS
jgi:hypothetical protein